MNPLIDRYHVARAKRDRAMNALTKLPVGKWQSKHFALVARTFRDAETATAELFHDRESWRKVYGGDSTAWEKTKRPDQIDNGVSTAPVSGVLLAAGA